MRTAGNGENESIEIMPAAAVASPATGIVCGGLGMNFADSADGI